MQYAPPSALWISIHSLRMEGDRPVSASRKNCSTFQSTPSAWRETIYLVENHKFRIISIHSLRMEGDFHFHFVLPPNFYFNPLPPHGGRRLSFVTNPFSLTISIHSLRMEGDPLIQSLIQGITDFNPLPPHGGRRRNWKDCAISVKFQSTPSAWRETTSGNPGNMEVENFNPLPPHGGRPAADCRPFAVPPFQSTPSAWRETNFLAAPSIKITFQSTPSAWRETDKVRGFVHKHKAFQSTPSAWRETLFWSNYKITHTISIHSLRMEGDSKTAQESVFHFAYPCTILQKRMQKTTFCTRKNGFFRKKGEKFGAKPSASFCAPMIRTDTFPLNFSHRISGSSMSMVSFAPICSTFD